MKKVIFAAFVTAALFVSCNGKSGAGSGDEQSTPKGVANMIFSAAKSGDYSKLKSLCDDSLQPDGDSKHICDVTDGDAELKSRFKEYFEKGKVVGDPTVEGDDAKVNVTLGTDGTKEGSFKMKKKDGKWYIVSF